MSTRSRQRRIFAAFLLLAALLLGGLPVRAQANRRPPAEVRKITVLGEGALWLRRILASLWHPETIKEGPTLDPHGQPAPGASSDEDPTIDPNG